MMISIKEYDTSLMICGISGKVPFLIKVIIMIKIILAIFRQTSPPKWPNFYWNLELI